MPNSYADAARAKAYAKLSFPGTYHLAFRDLPALISQHTTGTKALDFGCGAGRSTRFLKGLGFSTTGVDISPEMLTEARAADPSGNYLLTTPNDLSALPLSQTNLILSAFTFDNIPTLRSKALSLKALSPLLAPQGVLVNIVSSPAIYLHEWASFSTKAYPENRHARSGDKVRIVITDTDDPRPVVDTVCTEDDYLALYTQANLTLLHTHKPLGAPDDNIAWKTETTIPPWTIQVLGGPAP